MAMSGNALRSKSWSTLVPWICRLGLAAPAIIVAVVAFPRFMSGLAEETAVSMTAYMKLNIDLPRNVYADASEILSHAASNNGEMQELRAEAIEKGGGDANSALSVAIQALRHGPANARGWIELAELLRNRNPNEAAAALALALELAPHEYFQIEPRLIVGAALWDRLPPDARVQLLSDANEAVSDPDFHATLRKLLRVPGGPALVSRVFDGRPEALRAFNRRMTRERLGL